MAIDNSNFQRILANFSVVRLRDYNLEEELAAQAISRSLENRMVQRRQSRKEKDTNYHSVDQNAAFWVKLKSSAEEKLGSAKAEAFCKAFQEVYRTLVFEELSAEAAQNFINSP